MQTNNPANKNTQIEETSSFSYSLIAKVCAAIAVLSLIFLPVVGCGGENATGIDILSADKNNVPQEIKVFFIASIICGCIIFLLNKYISIAVTAIIGIISLLISYSIVKNKLEVIELKAGAILAIISYAIAALISFIKMSEKNNKVLIRPREYPPNQRKTETSNDEIALLEKLYDLRQKGILTEEEFINKKKDLLKEGTVQELPIAKEPEQSLTVNITEQIYNQQHSTPLKSNIPKIDWNATSAKAGEFIKKYKWLLLSLLAAIIIFVIVYNIFIKKYPESDAKKLASVYCDCNAEKEKLSAAAYQKFSDEFDSNKFPSRHDARNALQRVDALIALSYDSCRNAANQAFNNRRADYQDSKNNDQNILGDTYNNLINGCIYTPSPEVATLQNAINDKINTLTDPEPDTSKIKADLIGNQILGWRFNFVNEIQNIAIIDSFVNANQIQYDINLTLFGQGDIYAHNAQIQVNYLNGYNGWNLTQVIEKYITYNYYIPVGQWVTVTPLANCKWTASNSYKMFWKDSEWGYQYESGPTLPHLTLPFSQSYMLTSGEPIPFIVTFTYSPNN